MIVEISDHIKSEYPFQRNFFHLATVEQEIRDEINCMAANNERPIDVALRIRSFPNLRVTAANKMRSAVRSSLTFSGSKIQFRSINIKNKEMIEKNFNAVDSLLSNLNKRNITILHIIVTFLNKILLLLYIILSGFFKEFWISFSEIFLSCIKFLR